MAMGTQTRTATQSPVKVWRRRLLSVLLLVTIALVGGLPGCALFGGDEAFELSISASKDFSLPVTTSSIPGAGTGTAAPADVDLPLGDIPMNLADSSAELNDNKDKLRSITIDKIIVTPNDNTLVDGNLPPITLAFGPPAGGSGEVFTVATIPSIGPGMQGPIQAEINVAGMASAQQYITSLNFTLKMGETIPGGGVNLNIEMKITATVDPTK